MKGLGRIIVAIVVMAVAALFIHVLGGTVIQLLFKEAAGQWKGGPPGLFIVKFFLLNLYTAVLFFILFKILARRLPVGDFLRPLVFALGVWLIASIPQGAGEWIKGQTNLSVVLIERIEDLLAFGVMGLAIYFITIRTPKTREVTVTPE